MHFPVLIIIPRTIYEEGYTNIRSYIYSQISDLRLGIRVDPYILKHHDKLYNEFIIENKLNKYKSLEDYIQNNYDAYLDYNKNLISTENPKGICDWFEIGGRWDGVLCDNIIKEDMIDDNMCESEYELKNNLTTIRNILDKLTKNNDIYPTIIDCNNNIITKIDYPRYGIKCLMSDDEWKTIYQQTLYDNIDEYVVNLDCHI